MVLQTYEAFQWCLSLNLLIAERYILLYTLYVGDSIFHLPMLNISPLIGHMKENNVLSTPIHIRFGQDFVVMRLGVSPVLW